ncbi:Ribosomal protein L13e domain-containing protein [Rozella allomycis CSF55]|uniref:60S ribosomal protein L13 n=1 Tax=Rozella allomycis (strain CSF55) TaxID=988480 RepID=A0A075AUF5_ROZAC|nr:Ribosomal protein L13e domain-containing protein [Rozella allomycis CSF55]|eukprot:EPZ33898.1 Ribosomal protein L13e domain-containing protein [Rozella allomycis CSF55]
MVKHNNVLPNQHFRKHWQTRVKTWFDQPGKKKSRRLARMKKAELIAPRPVDGLLRPAVRGQTVRYNMKLRAGRGFSLEELKAAGVRKKEARVLGISVDHRRKNRSVESLQLNIERLKAYKSKLIVFPRKAKNIKKSESSLEEVKQATQLKTELMPIVNDNTAFEGIKNITAAEKEFKAYETLRKAWNVARYDGIRKKRAADKAAAEEMAKKK